MMPMPSSGAHLPCLDGLRAIAVLLVMLFHQQFIEFGWIGVQIFFVLSGYLITRILYEAKSQPLGLYVRNFYGRRSLRIFPVYYLYLAVVAVAMIAGLSMAGVREGLPYAATYTYNFWHASDEFVHSRMLSHLWSLAVEEQFYLFWPFLIWFCSAKRIGPVLIGIVVAGPIVRLCSFAILDAQTTGVWESTDIAVYALTSTHIDAFAIGGLASLFPLGGSRKLLLGSAAMIVIAGAAIVLSSEPSEDGGAVGWKSAGYPLGMAPAYGYVWGYTLFNVFSAALIDCIAHRRFAPKVFEFPLLQEIGKISYGVYLFHYPVQSLVDKAFGSVSHVGQFAIQLALTLAIAAASFHLFETRVLRLKDIWFPKKVAPAR